MSNDGRAIRRTLAILRAVNRQHGQWFGVTDIALRTHLAKSVVHRCLTVFVDEHVLEQDEDTLKYRKVQTKQAVAEVSAS